jgi:hypothetical protein
MNQVTTVRIALLAALVVSTAHATDTASVPALSVAPPAAHWVERKFDYTYMGFTTHYSCDGLRDNVRQVLLALGARKKDLKIQSTGCSRLNGPEPFPGVSATFSVLAPLTPDDVGKVGNTTRRPTQWHTVDVVRLSPFTSDRSGQCELLQQLKEKALPLFTSRNLVFRAACVPHQLSLGDIQFSVDVLTPAAGTAAAGPGPAS